MPSSVTRLGLRTALAAAAFLLTTSAGLAAPSAGYVVHELGPQLDTKGGAMLPKDEEAKGDGPGSALAQVQPLFNLDPRLPAEVEPNGTPATATALTLDANGFIRITGNVFGNGDVDYYSFSGSAGDRIYAATMTSASASGNTDTQLRLFGTDGTTLIELDTNDGSLGASSSSIAGATLPGAGTFFLEVRGGTATAQSRPYDLYVQRRSGSPVAETEPNNDTATATPLPGSRWVSGTRGSPTDADFFSFTLNAGDTVFLSLDLDPERDNVQWNGRLGLGVFGNPANILVVNDASAGSVANPLSEAFFFTVKDAGTYFAYVDSAVASGDATFTYHLSASVMPAPTGGACTTYTSTNVPVTIPPDPAITTSTLTVPGNPRIADLNVAIQLNHTFMPDLDVSLIAPDGNVVGLFTDIGASTQQGMDLVLDDEAGVPFAFTVVSGMHYRPELNYSLGWFDGQNAGGTWTLDIRDDAVGDGGTLTGWSITVCEPPPPPSCPAGFVQQTVFSTDFEAGAAGFTSSGTANEWELGLPSFAPITTCNSGSSCFATDLDNTYDVSSNQELLSPAFNLAGLSPPVLVRWAQKYQMESASFDQYNVVAREVGNPANAVRLFEWLGATMTNPVGNPTVTLQSSAGWGQFTARADALAGLNGEVAFTLVSDTTVNFAGAAIDDVSVTACRALSADLSITKTNGTANSVPGTNTVYTIVASNAGPDPVTGATVADTFPAACSSVTWTCVGAGGGTCPANGSGNINASVNLPAGGSTTFTATCAIAPSAVGTLANTATVASAITDPVPGNNSATDSDSLTASADLGITLGDSPDPVTAGSNLTYAIAVSNNGPSDAQAVSASLPLPTGTTFVSFTASAGSNCTTPAVGANGTVTCSWAGGTAPSTSRTASVVVAVDIAAVGPLSATATATSSTPDSVPGNNSAVASTAVAPPPTADMSIVLTSAPAQVAPGGTVTFTAVATNNGPVDASNVSISITPPAGATVGTPTASAGGSCVGTNPVVCTWPGTTAVGATRTATVPVTAPASVGTLSATATVSSATGDPVTANNSASASSSVIIPPPAFIPTASHFGLGLLALLLGMIGFVAVRRRA